MYRLEHKDERTEMSGQKFKEEEIQRLNVLSYRNGLKEGGYIPTHKNYQDDWFFADDGLYGKLEKAEVWRDINGCSDHFPIVASFRS